MSIECKEIDSPPIQLKNEAARQRWEMFHRAIAHAKQCNNAALTDADDSTSDANSPGPLLSIVR